MYDRSLLVKLSQCAWKVLSVYLKQGVSLDDPNPGAVIAVQTFGDFLNFNLHLHIIATDGCFDKDGGFMVGAVPDSSVLEELFRLQVFSMLKISFIEEEETTKKILLHLDLWMPGNHDSPNLYKEHQYIPASKPSGPSYVIVFYNNKEKTRFSQKAWYG